MKIVVLISVAWLLAGCATMSARTHEMTTTFDPAEVEWARAEGTNTVIGNAVLRTVSGEVRTCAGFEASLVPVSRYAAERIAAIYGSPEGGYSNANVQFGSTDARYMTERRKTTCDSQGNFRFDRVPDGDFYVVTRVTWGVPMGYGMVDTQGGNLTQKLSVRGGETRHVVLTAR